MSSFFQTSAARTSQEDDVAWMRSILDVARMRSVLAKMDKIDHNLALCSSASSTINILAGDFFNGKVDKTRLALSFIVSCIKQLSMGCYFAL
jgi:hypothetical protein